MPCCGKRVVARAVYWIQGTLGNRKEKAGKK